jgi:hypothetical protein
MEALGLRRERAMRARDTIVALLAVCSVGACAAAPTPQEPAAGVVIPASSASREELGVETWRRTVGDIAWHGLVGDWTATVQGRAGDGSTIVELDSTETLDEQGHRWDHVFHLGEESASLSVVQTWAGGPSLDIENSLPDASPKLRRSVELAIADAKATMALASSSSTILPRATLTQPGTAPSPFVLSRGGIGMPRRGRWGSPWLPAEGSL